MSRKLLQIVDGILTKMSYYHNTGDLVFIPANVLLTQEGWSFITTSKPEYALMLGQKNEHGKVKIFWKNENWMVDYQDIFPL